MLIRSILVARNLKGAGKDRDDLFAETPPLEAKGMLLSRVATQKRDGRWRKLLLMYARKAHFMLQLYYQRRLKVVKGCVAN